MGGGKYTDREILAKYAKETDPDAAEAALEQMGRGVLQRFEDIIDGTDAIRTDGARIYDLVGEQTTTGTDTTGALVKPDTNGVTGNFCDIYVENTGSSEGEVRRAGATPGEGIKIAAGDSVDLSDVTSTDDELEVAARSSTTDFLIIFAEPQ